MRAAFIFATLAVGAFAAPLPTAEPWSRMHDGTSAKDAIEMRDLVENELRAAAPGPFDRGTHSKGQSVKQEISEDQHSVAARSPSPEPFSRANHQDNKDPTLDTRSPSPEPFSRANHEGRSEHTLNTRSPLPEPFSRANHEGRSEHTLATRGPSRPEGSTYSNKPKYTAPPKDSRDNEIEDVQARGAIRNHGGKRSPTPGRIRWGGSKRSPAPGRVRWGQRSVCQPELDCETQEKRSIEDPVNDDGHHAGAEAVDGDLSERAAEAEPNFSRAGAGRRSAEPEPEPVVTGPGAGAGQLCLKGGRWVRC